MRPLVVVTGVKAGSGGDSRVGHVDLATALPASLTRADCDAADILTQRSTSTVCVT